MSTACTCCRGPRCVRVRPADEIALDAALLRLRDTLAREQPGSSRCSPRPFAHARPWEMTRREFDAVAAPSLQPTWGTEGLRFRGLSRSVLRREIQFVLRCIGGPVEGYRVRVPAGRPELGDQPHRAFVEAALAEGLAVPIAVLGEYPDLGSRSPTLPAPPPRLDGPLS